MNDCPTCGYPLVWSDDLARVRCSIYGDHPEQHPVGVCECSSCVLERARWARRKARLRAVS
jgi:hypothetical protein